MLTKFLSQRASQRRRTAHLDLSWKAFACGRRSRLRRYRRRCCRRRCRRCRRARRLSRCSNRRLVAAIERNLSPARLLRRPSLQFKAKRRLVSTKKLTSVAISAHARANSLNGGNCESSPPSAPDSWIELNSESDSSSSSSSRNKSGVYSYRKTFVVLLTPLSAVLVIFVVGARRVRAALAEIEARPLSRAHCNANGDGGGGTCKTRRLLEFAPTAAVAAAASAAAAVATAISSDGDGSSRRGTTREEAERVSLRASK